MSIRSYCGRCLCAATAFPASLTILATVFPVLATVFSVLPAVLPASNATTAALATVPRHRRAHAQGHRVARVQGNARVDASGPARISSVSDGRRIVKRSMGHGRIVGLDGKRELVHSTEGGDFYALSVSVFLNGKPECCFCGCRVCWGCFAETVESPPERRGFRRPR